MRYMDNITAIITNGLLKDLHIAERTFYLNRKISLLHSTIPEGYKYDISYILYDLSYTEMILGLSRLYDNLNNRYPTRCLKLLYKEFLVGSNIEKSISEKEISLRELGSLESFPEMRMLLMERTGDEFKNTLIMYLETLEVNGVLAEAIDKLKEIRDKFLAHNEDIRIDTLMPYTNLHSLIVHAKEVLAFFSLYCSGIHLTANGHFILSQSSLAWGSKYEDFINSKSA